MWKVSLGRRNNDTEYNRCKKDQCIAVDWLSHYDLTDKSYDELYDLLENEREDGASKPTQDANSLHTLINEMNKGDIVFIYDGPATIRDIGVVTGEYKYIKNRSFPHTRSVGLFDLKDVYINLFIGLLLIMIVIDHMGVRTVNKKEIIQDFLKFIMHRR